MLCALVGSMGATVRGWNPAPQPGRVTVLKTPDGGYQPQLAVDANGGLHLLYFKGDAAHGDLFYAWLEANGQFSPSLQVNTHGGSAIATGTMRGGQLAIGRGGRVHVAWQGSAQALPRTAAGTTPVLYTRMDQAGTAFELERNVVQQAAGLDGGGLAADALGGVYVVWHAGSPGTTDEGARRVWLARSLDDGRTFSRPTEISSASVGACGCCGVRALADRDGALYVLYRSATAQVHRDSYLLLSRDRGLQFSGVKLQDWNINACPMSTFALGQGPRSVLAAWETAGQVQWLRIDQRTGRRSELATAPGPAAGRKHPSITSNAVGDTLLVWTEGTSWNKGGTVAWQLFDQNGAATSEQGRMTNLPAWSLAAAAARANSTFVIVY